MLRQFILYVLIVAQVGISVTPAYALPEVAKGTQAPVTSQTDSGAAEQPLQVPPLSQNTPEMSLAEARRIIAEAERTKVSEILGTEAEPTTPEKKNRFRKFFYGKLAAANERIGLIPSKKRFLQHADGKDAEIINEGRKFKHSMQMFMTVTVIMTVAATTNAYFDIIPFGHWLDQVTASPTIREASAQTADFLSVYSGKFVDALGSAVVGGLKFAGTAITAVITYSFFNALITAFFKRTQDVLVQKLNNLSGVTQGRFAIWLLEKMDAMGASMSRFNSRIESVYRKVRGQKQVDTNASGDELLKAQELNRTLLSHISQLRSHMQAAGLTTGLTASELDKFLVEEKGLWAEWQNHYLNRFVETQRVGRTNVWESVYYSPQHFAALVRNAVSSADLNYEQFENTKDRIIRRNLDKAVEIDRVADQMKGILKEIRFNMVRDTSIADQYRIELETVKLRLAELGATPEQISRLEDLMTKYVHSNYEAVTNLVLHLRRDLEFPEFTVELPEVLYQRLLQVRENLGLSYYLRQMREEVIAVGEDYGLKLSAYSNFNEMYHTLRRETEAKQRLARAKKKGGGVKTTVAASTHPTSIPPGDCESNLN